MANRIPLLDNLTWNHPIVQQLQNAAISKVVDVVLPRPSAPPPNLVALDRIGETLDRIAAQHQQAKIQPEIAKEGNEPTTNVKTGVSSSTSLSEYLQQIGATDVDTGCLPCGRAHVGAAQAGLERTSEIARERGMDDREVRARVATVAEELDALLKYDWTPERIAKSPPAHRAALERYTPEVRDLRAALSPGGPAESLQQVSRDLKEALRFAREDGIDHPEARRRVSGAEATIDDLERYQLAPERVDEMDPEAAAWWEEHLKPIRRLRQQLHNEAKTPEHLHDVAAGFGRLATDAYGPYLQRKTPEELQSLAQYAADLRNRFKADTDNL